MVVSLEKMINYKISDITFDTQLTQGKRRNQQLNSVNNRKIEGTQETFQTAIDPDMSITTHRF